jgi:hypothetical protein
MLAVINPKIVAELETLAVSWTAVARDLGESGEAKRPRVRHRKRKPKSTTGE